MPICRVPSCNQFFSSVLWLEGKKHSLVSRKYCLTCSPFGSHNTKRKDGELDQRTLNGKVLRTDLCATCSKKNTTKKGLHCYGCNLRRRISARANLIYSIVGTACWFCQYDKGDVARSVLEWHHVDPSQKKLRLSTRELVGYTWAQVREELQKCVLLCCRCHREYHAGIISLPEIQALHELKWPLYVDKLPLTVSRYKNE